METVSIAVLGMLAVGLWLVRACVKVIVDGYRDMVKFKLEEYLGDRDDEP
jgi:hypothetical protein